MISKSMPSTVVTIDLPDSSSAFFVDARRSAVEHDCDLGANFRGV